MEISGENNYLNSPDIPDKMPRNFSKKQLGTGDYLHRSSSCFCVFYGKVSSNPRNFRGKYRKLYQ